MNKTVTIFNYLFTIVCSAAIVRFSSQGKILSDLKEYYSDGAFMVVFVFIGYVIGRNICQSSRHKIYLFLFYYFLFVFFSDGHVAGWSHTQSIVEKLSVSTLIVAPLMIMTIFVPAGVLALVLFQTYGVKYFCKKNNRGTHL